MTYIAQTLARPYRAINKTGFWTLLSLYRQRRTLAQLDPHLLKDIGITPEMARKEAIRPIWDAPAHWLQK